MTINRSWREACREIAQERAQQEAAQSWNIRPAQAIPFDYRWEHVQDVVKVALWLSAQIEKDEKTEPQTVEIEALEAAAWLHDICKTQPHHAEVGAAEAEQILCQTDFPPLKIPLVRTIIRQHEGMYRPEGATPIQPIEAAILWDADKLTKLGVQALAHSLCSPYFLGITLNERRKATYAFVHDVLSKTAYSMNTEPAQRLAVRRYREMLATLETWAREETESNIKE